jgi:subtilisin family serine protease
MSKAIVKAAFVIAAILLPTVIVAVFGFVQARDWPNDPLYPEQGYMAAIDIEGAWKHGLSGEGVKIAVIDSGVSKHPDLDSGRISGISYVDKDISAYDDCRGHGSFIVGMLAAKQDNGAGLTGMTKSSIVAYKVVGELPHISTDNVARAVRDAADTGCAVISISMGTPNQNAGLKEAVDYAVAKGAIVIAAAGGDSETACYPAAYDNVVGVEALSSGLEPMASAANNQSVFVTAPGERIIGIDYRGGYERNGAGASYAAAQVTALAAFAKQKQPDMTAEEFMGLLRQSSVRPSGKGYSTLYGWGVINAGSFAESLTAVDR